MFSNVEGVASVCWRHDCVTLPGTRLSPTAGCRAQVCSRLGGAQGGAGQLDHGQHVAQGTTSSQRTPGERRWAAVVTWTPRVMALGTGPSRIYGWFQMNSSILSFFGTGSGKKADNKQRLSMASHNSWNNICIAYHGEQEPTCPGLRLPSNLSQHHFPSCAQLQPPALPAMPFP